MIENRKFYWIKTPVLTVSCQKTAGECQIIRAATDAGVEYRYWVDADAVKNISFDYFPHKVANINDKEMVQKLQNLCRQCQLHILQKTKKR